MRQFWTWFVLNKSDYEDLNLMEQNAIAVRFDRLNSELHKLAPELSVEIGGQQNRRPHELIITAQGIKKHFATAELLAGRAPIIDGWQIIALKQPIGKGFVFQQGGIEISEETVSFVPFSDPASPDAVNIKLIHAAFEPEQEESAQGNNMLIFGIYAILDSYLGEKGTTLDIQEVRFANRPDAGEHALPINELPDYIEDRKQAREISGVRFPETSVALLQGKREGLPVMLMINSALDFYGFKQQFPWLLTLEIPFKSVNDNGFPAEPMDDMYAIEDHVASFLAQQELGHHVMSDTCNGSRTAYFYLSSEDAIQQACTDLEGNTHDYAVHTAVRFDPYWVETSDFVK